MEIREVVEFFESQMMNEIFNSTADDAAKADLVESLKDVAKTVIETYEAQQTTAQTTK